MNFVEKLHNYIKARYSLILIKTDEEDRLSDDLQKISEAMQHNLVTWSIASGLVQNGKVLDPSTAELKKALELCENNAKNVLLPVCLQFVQQ